MEMAERATGKQQEPLLVEDLSRGRGEKTLFQEYKIYFVIGTITTIIIIGVILMVMLIPNKTSKDRNYRQRIYNTPNSHRIMDNSELFTLETHVAGSIWSYKYAEILNDKFLELGFNSTIVNYTDTVVSAFVSSSLKQLNPSNPSNIIDRLNLHEKYIPDDPTSNTPLRNQSWLGYSASGNVTAYLIYVNYGTVKDFDLLFNQMNYSNILASNPDTEYIAIMKYGSGITRGLKVRLAADYGLSGVLLYSDPIDYGPNRGDVFPNGPWLPKSGFQRGAASSIEYCFGNPSVERASAVCNKTQDEILPTIPVIPLSWGNAYKLMSQFGGESVNDEIINYDSSWQGGFNFTYNIGAVRGDELIDDGILVNLQIETERLTTTTANVIAKLNDEVISEMRYPSESIMLGNHRDAWVYGASDPMSGTTVIIEVANAIQTAIKRGWKPKRNIYFGSWDAEEMNLIGSTQFVENERNRDFIENELVVYLNDDTSVSGRTFWMSGDPLLEHVIRDIADMVNYPKGYDEKKGTSLLEVFDDGGMTVGVLGSGSDFSAYVHEFGITAFDSGFTGLGGTYHSTYDSYAWMNLVDDKRNFARVHAQFLGLLAYEFMNEDVVPFNVSHLYVRMLDWITVDIQMLIDENIETCDVGNVLQSDLMDSVWMFGDEAERFENEKGELGKWKNDGDEIEEFNRVQRKLGSVFIFDGGLPTRKLYKNVLYASSLDSGYAAQVFPYIAYAIKYDCSEEMLDEAYTVTIDRINNATRFLADHLN